MQKVRSHKKITSKIVFNEMQKIFFEKHFDEFIKFDYLNDRFDVFLGKYFPGNGDLWRVCKSMLVLSH